MRKLGILGAMVAVIAVSAIAAAGASANVWLHNGEEVKTATNAISEGTLEFHNEFLFIETTILCNGLFLGTVGPGNKDLVSEVHNLALTELGLVKCEEHPGLCENPVLHAVNLPWNTELLATSPIEDKFTEDGKGEPGWLVLCSGEPKDISCFKDARAKFVKNTSSGAEFEYTREGTETPCSTGTGWITGKGITKGLTVS